MARKWKDTLLQLLLNNLLYLQQNAYHESERKLYKKNTIQFLYLYPDAHRICESFHDLDIIKGINA
ncbi:MULTISPECIES: hypothetical protein [unclassified Amedibacterium]|uniref:hypothetical protein n=1 Tax=unclassified Amedibacterium TaxID=3088137 RepID=UPI000E3F1CA3|nr:MULTISPECIES: hypothetical protein [unclassified Absiella]RGB68143.1 hypothetical protein DW113_05070 [Absiella sp. AM09-45]RGB79360.1 hypothetical protein DW114_01615 [Absiella sp. AM09-50]RGC44945.1 hypothetical protein DW761_19355 [Absiella sp. AM29-15]